MTELWENATVAQALLIALAAWVLLSIGDNVVCAIRARRGLLNPGDHCSHCDTVAALDEHLEKLTGTAGDIFTVIEEMNGTTRQGVDDLAVVHERVDDLVRAVSAVSLAPAAAARS